MERSKSTRTRCCGCQCSHCGVDSEKDRRIILSCSEDECHFQSPSLFSMFWHLKDKHDDRPLDDSEHDYTETPERFMCYIGEEHGDTVKYDDEGANDDIMTCEDLPIKVEMKEEIMEDSLSGAQQAIYITVPHGGSIAMEAGNPQALNLHKKEDQKKNLKRGKKRSVRELKEEELDEERKWKPALCGINGCVVLAPNHNAFNAHSNAIHFPQFRITSKENRKVLEQLTKTKIKGEPPTFICKLCQATFGSKSKAVLHVSKKHDGEMQMCPFCSFKTKFSYNIRRHAVKIHRIHQPFNFDEEKQSLLDEAEKEYPNFGLSSICGILGCEEKVENNLHLVYHRDIVHFSGREFDLENNEKFRQLLKMPESDPEVAEDLLQNNYKCTDCGDEFKYGTEAEVHVFQTHMPEENLKCPVKFCEFKTGHTNMLKDHFKTSHYTFISDPEGENPTHGEEEEVQREPEGERIYLCYFSDCPFEGDRVELSQHLEEVHLKDPKYDRNYDQIFRDKVKFLNEDEKTKKTKYQCSICGKKLNDNRDIKNAERHVASKHFKHLPQLDCFFCLFKTCHRGQFRVHLKVKHAVRKELNCSICDFSGASIKELADHYVINRSCQEQKAEREIDEKRRKIEKGKLLCDLCGFKGSKKEVNLHKKASHGSYLCDQCDFHTPRYVTLLNHKKRGHRELCPLCKYHIVDGTEKCPMTTFGPGPPDDQTLLEIVDHDFKWTINKSQIKKLKDNSYICLECGLMHEKQGWMVAHVSTAHGKNKCNLCEFRSARKPGLQRHIQEEHTPKCMDCGEIFESNDKKNFHKCNKSDKSIVNGKCPICGYVSKPKDVVSHMKQVHGEAKVECDVCLKKFKTVGRMSYHKKLVHTKVRGYQCTVCGEEFTYLKSLQIHEAKVHGSKIFECREDNCNFTSETEYRLILHRKKEHHKIHLL